MKNFLSQLSGPQTQKTPEGCLSEEELIQAMDECSGVEETLEYDASLERGFDTPLEVAEKAPEVLKSFVEKTVKRLKAQSSIKSG